jgi:hypothetical protein
MSDRARATLCPTAPPLPVTCDGFDFAAVAAARCTSGRAIGSRSRERTPIADDAIAGTTTARRITLARIEAAARAIDPVVLYTLQWVCGHG